MTFFKKRETITQNIAYMAIMAGINVIFVLLTALFPPLMFVLIFALPLASAIVTLFCQKKYYPIYAIVTVALCLIVTSGIYIYDTFFYVIPSLITGFIFGIMIEKRAPAIYIVSLCTFAQYGISYLTFIIMTAIMPEMNFINIFLSIFGLSDFIYKDTFSHLFIYIIASIQIVFTYFLLGREVRKLGFEVNLDINYKWVMFLISMILIVISIIMYFVYTPLLYVFMVANLPLVIYQVINVISYKKKINYVFLVISLFIGVGLFAGLYSLIPHPKSIILFSIMFFLFSLIYFVNYLFMNKTKIAKIDY